MLPFSDLTTPALSILGLKEINVTSADEAYKLLTIGQRNLKTACTRLNHSSSRRYGRCVAIVTCTFVFFKLY